MVYTEDDFGQSSHTRKTMLQNYAILTQTPVIRLDPTQINQRAIELKHLPQSENVCRVA